MPENTITEKRTECPGSNRKITQKELNDIKKGHDKWGYPITRYKCQDCGKYYTKKWGDNCFTRHGFKIDETEKKYRAAKKLEKQRAEEEKKRKQVEKAEKKRIEKLILAGKVCFCAECDGYIFDMTDYLCSVCRANL
jgi:hypothetical protein